MKMVYCIILDLNYFYDWYCKNCKQLFLLKWCSKSCFHDTFWWYFLNFNWNVQVNKSLFVFKNQILLLIISNFNFLTTSIQIIFHNKQIIIFWMHDKQYHIQVMLDKITISHNSNNSNPWVKQLNKAYDNELQCVALWLT